MPNSLDALHPLEHGIKLTRACGVLRDEGVLVHALACVAALQVDQQSSPGLVQSLLRVRSLRVRRGRCMDRAGSQSIHPALQKSCDGSHRSVHALCDLGDGEIFEMT